MYIYVQSVYSQSIWSVSRSINISVHPSTDQFINYLIRQLSQLVSQSINISVRQSHDQSVWSVSQQSINLLINSSITWSVNSVGQSVNQHISSPIYWSITQSIILVSQSINQHISLSISLLGQSIRQVDNQSTYQFIHPLLHQLIYLKTKHNTSLCKKCA